MWSLQCNTLWSLHFFLIFYSFFSILDNYSSHLYLSTWGTLVYSSIMMCFHIKVSNLYIILIKHRHSYKIDYLFVIIPSKFCFTIALYHTMYAKMFSSLFLCYYSFPTLFYHCLVSHSICQEVEYRNICLGQQSVEDLFF